MVTALRNLGNGFSIVGSVITLAKAPAWLGPLPWSIRPSPGNPVLSPAAHAPSVRHSAEWAMQFA
jgi:hypothetical protein